MDDVFEREDVDAILSGVFDANATLSSIDRKLQTLLNWLDMGDDDEEEEDDPLAPDS
jgi:predicted component of type VI protein secretion system